MVFPQENLKDVARKKTTVTTLPHDSDELLWGFYASTLATAIARRHYVLSCLSFCSVVNKISQEHPEGISSNLSQTFT